MSTVREQSSAADNSSRGKKENRNWRTATNSDRHELYELSVQETESEIDFIDEVWEERRGRLARSIREDFCGTGASSVEWVRRRDDNTAVAIDLDESVLQWGRAKMQSRLTRSQRDRLTLKKADVRKERGEPVDSVLAMNFSYYSFKSRKKLKKYFKHVHRCLDEDGMFILDAYGGSDSFLEGEEERDLDGFTYVWDTQLYNPITGDVRTAIHFRFPNGSEMTNAFTYDWRLWSLPEIQELLEEAGFERVTVYWEGTDEETGEGDSEFTPSTRGEACEGWIAYLVAEK